MEYAVYVTTNGRWDGTDDQVDTLMAALAPVHGAPGETALGLSAQVTVEADDLHDAGRSGADAVTAAFAAAGVDADIVSVEVMTDEAFTASVYGADLRAEMISTTQAAVLLGVSRQRVLQLASSHPDFPRPVVVGERARAWSRPALRRFLSTWDRSSGVRLSAR